MRGASYRIVGPQRGYRRPGDRITVPQCAPTNPPTNPTDDPRPNDTVAYRLDDHVSTITYHRPERLNAIDGAMRQGLNAAFARFRDDPEAWVAIVTGAGRAFCVGADLRSETARRLVAAAPLAQRAIKEVATRTADMGMIEATRFGETMRRVAGTTDDATEGRRAAAERRPPRWRAR